jgi:hypothetical protein
MGHEDVAIENACLPAGAEPNMAQGRQIFGVCLPTRRQGIWDLKLVDPTSLGQVKSQPPDSIRIFPAGNAWSEN